MQIVHTERRKTKVGLIKTYTIDQRWKISVNCVKETLDLKRGDKVEIHVSNGKVELRKKKQK